MHESLLGSFKFLRVPRTGNLVHVGYGNKAVRSAGQGLKEILANNESLIRNGFL
ncbi:hypothetical protein SAMN05421505_112123 [Sinosporangium album]|uniref:Uncharacterized protein n=1 Tax=Sinosporangium album TaxID=504805 RepID=A0A1G8AER6_9ACTN|nr:hypothetical protein SAMN05421505_112123 [Sinosporangium album]